MWYFILYFINNCIRGCKMNTHQKALDNMIEYQIKDRGISDENVLKALRDVPRHWFVPKNLQPQSYQDYPLPIGNGQTISQPYIVAYMTEVALLKSQDKVLEIGTGSGYQAAILSKIAKEVYTIEIIEELGKSAQKTFKKHDLKNIKVKIEDGNIGWKEHSPFDAIIVTAAPDQVPQALIDQLKVGGRLIIPIGTFFQELIRITKTDSGLQKEDLLPVRFVPMTGKPQN
jgi:protein-L-isoaspartate(D-aspartate) O-methyltransferase